ncbi:hypothetical protein [Rhodococcus sp. IEGM 1366]|uniref:hypothetical protein n=1 Tax=Rhodococcus sp. IEGM 1366 TaxID=3082223 RepID=UPI0039894613
MATVTQRPANVVNLVGNYAIRVDLEYNRYLVATNTTRGLSDEPDTSDSWTARIFHTTIAEVPDALLGEAAASGLISAFAHLDTDANNIVRTPTSVP